MTSRRKVFVSAAIVLSLLLHGLVLYWFSDIRIGPLAIPAQAHRLLIPLRLKRIEIPAETLSPAPPVLTPATPLSNTLPARLPEAADAVPESLRGVPPPVLPDAAPGAAPAFVPVVPAPPAAASPYALNDRARLDAEIAQFAVGPSTPGLPAALPSAPAPPGSLSSSGDQESGQEGSGLVPSSGALPSLDEVAARFQIPPPTLNPNLPQPIVLTLPTDILFDFDSAQLRSGADGLMRQALDYFRRYPKAEIEIDGFTDSFGTAAYNQKLSEDRAVAVQTWLQAHLPEADYTITARGFGAAQPVVDPHGTIAQQQKNRRVEVILRALAPLPSGTSP